LVKKEKYEEAVKYSKKNLSKFADDNLDRLKRVMGLLCFSKERIDQVEKYKELFDERKWKTLIDMFVQESYYLHSLTANPLLLKCLNIGVSILKTVF
jgi:hypothetical protein